MGLLVVAVAAFFATASVRQQTLTRTELIRHEVASAEKQAEEEREARRMRQERLQVMEQLASDPENVKLLLRAASLYGQDRRYDDAIFLLEEARRLAPNDPEPYRALYQAYVAQGQFDRAYDYANEGLKRFPKDLELVLGACHLDTLVGWNAQARELLNRLSGTPDGDNPRVRVASALVYRQVTDSRHAEADLAAAIRQDPKNDTVYALLSGVQWEVGKGKEAEESIRKALALKPDNPDYLLHLSEIQLRGRTPELIEASRQTAEHALRADPGNRNAFFAMAMALLAEKRTAEAQEILERLLQRYPDYTQAGYDLAQIYLRSGRQEEAQRLLKEYSAGVHDADTLKSLTLKVSMLPDAPAPLLDLGRFYNDSGSHDKAVLVLRRALALQPGSTETRRQLARALEGQNRSGEYAELAARPQWHVVDLMTTGA